MTSSSVSAVADGDGVGDGLGVSLGVAVGVSVTIGAGSPEHALARSAPATSTTAVLDRPHLRFMGETLPTYAIWQQCQQSDLGITDVLTSAATGSRSRPGGRANNRQAPIGNEDPLQTDREAPLGR